MFGAVVSSLLSDTPYIDYFIKKEQRSGGMKGWLETYNKKDWEYRTWRWNGPTYGIAKNLEVMQSFVIQLEALEKEFTEALTPGARQYLDFLNGLKIDLEQTYSADSYAESNRYAIAFLDTRSGKQKAWSFSGHCSSLGVHAFRDLPKDFLSEEGVKKKEEFVDLVFGKKSSGEPSL